MRAHQASGFLNWGIPIGTHHITNTDFAYPHIPSPPEEHSHALNQNGYLEIASPSMGAAAMTSGRSP
ncbi:MAG: hypothetical protein JOY54_04920 [Acidobacteriaceae bacterium]|nr:hypothetical protein [Acidobacteriaceae bacterium]